MAIRSGNRPDGRQLAPAMPWLNYSNLSEPDAMAIAAYLKTLKPVKHAVPKPLPPGAEAKGPVLAFPPPSAWDAPREAAAEPKK
jgi:cytochrome c553